MCVCVCVCVCVCMCACVCVCVCVVCKHACVHVCVFVREKDQYIPCGVPERVREEVYESKVSSELFFRDKEEPHKM